MMSESLQAFCPPAVRHSIVQMFYAVKSQHCSGLLLATFWEPRGLEADWEERSWVLWLAGGLPFVSPWV